MNEASARTINPKTMRGPFCEWAEVPDTAYDDGKLALKAIADLKRLKEQGKPFFMACGFWKPHLPFNAPKNIGIYMTERKFQLLTIVFVLKIYRMRLKTLQKSTLTHVPPQQMIFLFRKKPNMDIMLV